MDINWFTSRINSFVVHKTVPVWLISEVFIWRVGTINTYTENMQKQTIIF